MRVTIDENLEALLWIVNNTPEVNPIQADSYTLTPYPGGITSTIVGKPYAGALGQLPSLQLLPNTTLVTLSYRNRLPMALPQIVQAAEFDVMISLANGDVLNGSCQCDVANGFMWEITKVNPVDNSAPWVATGFQTPLSPGVWNSIQVVWKIDQKNEVISCLSITVNGNTFLIPAKMQNQPPQKLKWGPMIIVGQCQYDLSGLGGAYSADNDTISIAQQ